MPTMECFDKMLQHFLIFFRFVLANQVLCSSILNPFSCKDRHLPLRKNAFQKQKIEQLKKMTTKNTTTFYFNIPLNFSFMKYEKML